MFKCKKCESGNYKLIEKGTATGLYCADCGFWHKWVAKDELYRYQGLQETKELSTAEKLCYIVTNCYFEMRDQYDEEPNISVDGEPYYFKYVNGDIDLNSFNQAIDTAFKAVKERKNGRTK